MILCLRLKYWWRSTTFNQRRFSQCLSNCCHFHCASKTILQHDSSPHCWVCSGRIALGQLMRTCGAKAHREHGLKEQDKDKPMSVPPRGDSEPRATWNSPMLCSKLKLPPWQCEDENQLKALTRHWVLLCILHQSHCLHQNDYFSPFKDRKHPHLLYLDAGRLKKESSMKTAWMNLLNGKPLPTSLNDFSSRDVFAGFASEKK